LGAQSISCAHSLIETKSNIKTPFRNESQIAQDGHRGAADETAMGGKGTPQAEEEKLQINRTGVAHLRQIVAIRRRPRSRRILTKPAQNAEMLA
jgi:hypothetical protein